MKNNRLLACVALLCLVAFHYSGSKSFAGMFDDDEEKRWEAIFTNLKKINIRLQNLETQELKKLGQSQEKLGQTQADMSSQLTQIQQLIPSLQGILEQSKAEIAKNLADARDKTAEFQRTLQREAEDAKKRQSQELTALKNETSTQQGQVRQGFAADMEALEKRNKQYFDSIAKTNAETLEKVVAQISQQNQKMAETNHVLKSELIPSIVNAIVDQNQKNTARILQELKANQEAIIKGFATIELKNKMLIEILEKSLNAQKASAEKLDLLDQNIRTTNGNVLLAGEKVDKHSLFSDKESDKTNKIAEGMKNLLLQNATLGTSLTTIYSDLSRIHEVSIKSADRLATINDVALKNISDRSLLLDQKMDQSIGKIDQVTAADKQRDEKIVQLMDFMKVASEHSEEVEGKLDLSAQKIDMGTGNVNIANEKLGKLIEILKTMATAQGKVDQVIKDQDQIKQILEDLRKKAEMTLARNDDIKKELTELHRKSGTNGGSSPKKSSKKSAGSAG